MFDCGIPFKRMKEELYNVDTLLLTHTHSDHINAKTLSEIKKQFPRIAIYGNYDVAYQYGEYLTKIIGEAPIKLTGKRVVYPHTGLHDVPLTYYSVDFDGQKVFYATDTSLVENLTGWKYDAIFLESNYDPVKLAEIRKGLKSGDYDPYNGSVRHLSTHQCKEFYYVNRKDKDSPLIELHKSSRFY